MNKIKELESRFYALANELNAYKKENGFAPGARVKAQYRDESPKMGTIAPYGDEWATVDIVSVPVRLDAGYTQPWLMSNLTPVTPELSLSNAQGSDSQP